MKPLSTLLTTVALLSGPALAQLPPPSKPAASDIKAKCLAEAKKSGLTGAALEKEIKKCIQHEEEENKGAPGIGGKKN